ITKIAAVLDQVSGVKEIEDFAEQNKASALTAEWEAADQAQILCEKAVIERIASGQRYSWSDLAASSEFAGKLAIIILNQSRQIIFSRSTIELINSRSRQQIVLSTIAVKVDSAHVCRKGRPAVG